MKFRKSLISVLGLVFAPPLFGQTFFQETDLWNMTKGMSPSTSGDVVTRERCTNFSGAWEGGCVQNGESFPNLLHMDIQQTDCVVLFISGSRQPIDGSVNTSRQGPRGSVALPAHYVFQNSEQLYWGDLNDPHLYVRSNATGHSIDYLPSVRSAANSLSTWTLENPTSLRIDRTTTGFFQNGMGELPINLSMVCQLQKQ